MQWGRLCTSQACILRETVGVSATAKFCSFTGSLLDSSMAPVNHESLTLKVSSATSEWQLLFNSKFCWTMICKCAKWHGILHFDTSVNVVRSNTFIILWMSSGGIFEWCNFTLQHLHIVLEFPRSCLVVEVHLCEVVRFTNFICHIVIALLPFPNGRDVNVLDVRAFATLKGQEVAKVHFRTTLLFRSVKYRAREL